MPTEVFLLPYNDGTVDLQLQDGESISYAGVTTVTRAINDWLDTATPDLPVGYDEILATVPIHDNSDPPQITGYRLHCLRSETVATTYGGVVIMGTARAGLPVAIAKIHSSQAKLDVLNTRCRALSPTNFYGRVPLTANAATRDAIANKLDELAILLAARPAIATALAQAADEVGALNNLQTWRTDFYAILGRLFVLNPARIDMMSLPEPAL